MGTDRPAGRSAKARSASRGWTLVVDLPRHAVRVTVTVPNTQVRGRECPDSRCGRTLPSAPRTTFRSAWRVCALVALVKPSQQLGAVEGEIHQNPVAFRVGFWPIGVPPRRTAAKDDAPSRASQASREPDQPRAGELQRSLDPLRHAGTFRPMVPYDSPLDRQKYSSKVQQQGRPAVTTNTPDTTSDLRR
ncbi:hypothetical protein P3T36_006740 [Kitasatospora sp. MAP12-15]|uniref:hypothetical protein n=1 Tax=unclassified Kitasatospora TaxID=2633591 RepID=UPI002474F183|nr:hypothetical protein [Kitasatospora sp. MAP12-44]MDH6111560.1 hypothetical protein [Kitasatospora sp. MAP12-44]